MRLLGGVVQADGQSALPFKISDEELGNPGGTARWCTTTPQLDRIEEAKSRDLFAESDVHSENIERRLHELIEDPLGRLWHRVRKEGVKEITDWREIRAAHLAFLAQPPRVLDRSRDPSIE